MAKNLQGTVKDAIGRATPSNNLIGKGRNSGGPLSGATGLAAGAGAAALAPLAFKGMSKLVKNVAVDGVGDAVSSVGDAVSAPGKAMANAKSGLGEKISSGIGDKVSETVDSAGGPSGILKDGVKGALGFGGGKKGGAGDALGTGKGRRMPVQQSVDIGAPLETVYNQWTQFEEWPNFMHRVTRVTQEDECTVSVAVKIWGKTKEFTAEIETQRPDEIVKWRTSEGMTHTGLVSFHEIGPRLTRVLLSLDVDPGGMFEKAARGMRHIKRAARGDLHRFKAFVEMEEEATGGWRGTIEEGEVVQEKASGGRGRGSRSGGSRSRTASSSSSRQASNRPKSRARGARETGSSGRSKSASGNRSRGGSSSGGSRGHSSSASSRRSGQPRGRNS